MSKDQYAVIGNPIAHSKSPKIHHLFAQQTQQSLTYQAMFSERDKFASIVKKFVQQGGKGLNITIPFKEQAYQLVDDKTERATYAQAVNTIKVMPNAQLLGDNTDGVGLVNDLTGNYGLNLNQSRILLIGAGGASKGVLLPLLQQQPSQLVIANRTQSKAQALAKKFADKGNITACGLDQLTTIDQPFDLIINATSLSLQSNTIDFPSQLIDSNSWCYDMFYSKQATAFMQWGQINHAKQTLDGLGMLVEQAAESFYLWRNIKPETKIVLSTLRKNL